MANTNNIRVSDFINDKDLMEFLKKEDFWVFEKSDKDFRNIVFGQEIPIYLCARKGEYRQYNLQVPTALWLDMFFESFSFKTSGDKARVLFAIIHNLLYEHTLPEEFKKPLEGLFVRPYQGYGLMAKS